MKTTNLAEIPQEGVSHNPDILKQVMLRYGDVPFLTNFSQSRFQPGQVCDPHRHEDMWEVFFVEAGMGEIRIEGTPYPLTPGTCLVVAPQEWHELENTGDAELVLTYFGIAPTAG